MALGVISYVCVNQTEMHYTLRPNLGRFTVSLLLHPIGYESVTEVGPGKNKKKSRLHSPPFDKSHVNDMSKTATVVSS